MVETIDERVRSWIMMTMPGLFVGSDHGDVLRRALAASGIECELDDFAAALWRSGYVPRQVCREFRLVFPEPSRIAPDHFEGVKRLGSVRSQRDGQR